MERERPPTSPLATGLHLSVNTEIIQHVIIIAFLPLLGLSLHYFSRNKSKNQERLGFICTVCFCLVTGGRVWDMGRQAAFLASRLVRRA